MRVSFIVGVLSLLLCNSLYAYSNPRPLSGCLDCFNFVAPTILGAENVNPAEVGLIVYDSYYNKFRGYNANGSWSKLSNENNVRSISATATIYSTDDVVTVNASSGAVTLNLPSAASVMGKVFFFKKSDSSSNQVTIDPYTTELIDGVATKKLIVQNENIKLISDGTNWLDVTQRLAKTPTIQKFTSGSNTYYTPAGVTYIRVRMVGGGGGGGGGANTSTSGGTGGNGSATTFGTSLLIANGGSGGTWVGGGGGGSVNVYSPAIAFSSYTGAGGGAGFQNYVSSNIQPFSPSGASTVFGAGGAGVATGNTGNSAVTNSGGGGAGGGGSNAGGASFSGGAGGAGGFIDVLISSPSSTYSYAVGAAGTAGTAGTGGSAGGAGANGYIEVTEYYQ